MGAKCRFCGGANCEHGDHCADCGCPRCGFPGARYDGRGFCGDCEWEAAPGAYMAWRAVRAVPATEEFRQMLGLPADVVGAPIWKVES